MAANHKPPKAISKPLSMNPPIGALLPRANPFKVKKELNEWERKLKRLK